MRNNLNRFLEICLDIAEYYDSKCEENNFFFEDDLTKATGLGCKALSGYLREGVKSVVELQGNYHTQKERTHSASFYIKAVDKIIPLLDPDLDSKKAINQIRDILSE